MSAADARTNRAGSSPSMAERSWSRVDADQVVAVVISEVGADSSPA